MVYRSGSLVVVGGVLAGMLVASPAHAGGKVKAHVECMSGLPIKSGKAAKLTEELWCTIRVDSLGKYKAAELKGHLLPHITQSSTLSTQPEARFGPLADTQDGVEFRLDKPFAVNVDYKTCEPFTIGASLDDESLSAEDMTVWSETFKVAATCPKPKKIAGTLRCHYSAQDGTLLKWPGNGAKLKPRMETTFYCSIVAPKSETGVKYEVSLGIAGKGTPKKGDFEHDEAGAPFFDAQFEEDVYQACSNFTVTGEVRAAGTSLWSGKLPIKQDCPD
ncbi:MAG: hypothetical protein IPQ07_43250 [Myxococcales bacterium]|nr:hypothetical protein [Myxococcales bacterium]